MNIDKITNIIDNIDYCNDCSNIDQECGECDICILDEIVSKIKKALVMEYKDD